MLGLATRSVLRLIKAAAIVVHMSISLVSFTEAYRAGGFMGTGGSAQLSARLLRVVLCRVCDLGALPHNFPGEGPRIGAPALTFPLGWGLPCSRLS